jgi:hypothetical protein
MRAYLERARADLLRSLELARRPYISRLTLIAGAAGAPAVAGESHPINYTEDSIMQLEGTASG